jgi:hypothetical protein
MVRLRLLRSLLILGGLFFVAGIYPLFTSIPQHQQSDYGDQMMLAVYFVLGVFLLLAVKRPTVHRSLIAFTGWGTLAHDAIMAVQASPAPVRSSSPDHDRRTMCRIDIADPSSWPKRDRALVGQDWAEASYREPRFTSFRYAELIW